MSPVSIQQKHALLILIGVILVVSTGFVDPIPQDQQYHQFADQRSYLSIPNTLNVVSNLLFTVAGIAGLYLLCVRRSLVTVDSLFPAYFTFFAALIAIAPGSAWYHWIPDNQSLVWDRLPMTLAFMSFFSIILGERISDGFAKLIFLPLLIVGVSSILYWSFSELAGSGDLRPYALVQFLPMLIIPLILLIFSSKYTRDRDIWIFLACYLAAKVLEIFDDQIFQSLGFISGHSLKHIAASIGTIVYLRYLHKRTAIS
ncbi:MAG: alkaline phytoceramidase [Gammaproteobacteria bacterium]